MARVLSRFDARGQRSQRGRGTCHATDDGPVSSMISLACRCQRRDNAETPRRLLLYTLESGDVDFRIVPAFGSANGTVVVAQDERLALDAEQELITLWGRERKAIRRAKLDAAWPCADRLCPDAL